MNLKMDMLHTVLHLPDVNCENVRQCNVLLWIQSHAEVKKNNSGSILMTQSRQC